MLVVMQTEKEQAISLIEQMPDTVSTETIITELQFRLIVLSRAAAAERGESVLSHDEARQQLSRWLNSPGT